MPNPKISICRANRSAPHHKISSSGAQTSPILTIGPWPATDSVPIQRSDGNPDLRPSLAISKTWSTVDGKIRARFKLIDGSMPSAGIVVRVTSPNDYHLVRVSAFERLSLLHVVNGTPEEIAGVDPDVTQNDWQSLEVVVNGNSFKTGRYGTCHPLPGHSLEPRRIRAVRSIASKRS